MSEPKQQWKPPGIKASQPLTHIVLSDRDDITRVVGKVGMPSDHVERLRHLVRLWALQSDNPRQVDNVSYRVIIRFRSEVKPDPKKGIEPRGLTAAAHVGRVRLRENVDQWLRGALNTIAGEVANRSRRSTEDIIPSGGWRPEHARRALELIDEAIRLGIDLESIGVLDQRGRAMLGDAVPPFEVVLAGTSPSSAVHYPEISVENVRYTHLWPIVDDVSESQLDEALHALNTRQLAAAATTSELPLLPTAHPSATGPLAFDAQTSGRRLSDEIRRFLNQRENVESLTLDLTCDVEAFVDFLYSRKYEKQLAMLAALREQELIAWDIDPRSGRMTLRWRGERGKPTAPVLKRVRQRMLGAYDPLKLVFGNDAQRAAEAAASGILPSNIRNIEITLSEFYGWTLPGWMQTPSILNTLEGYRYTQRIFGVSYAGYLGGNLDLIGNIAAEDIEYVSPFGMVSDAVRLQEQQRRMLDLLGAEEMLEDPNLPRMVQGWRTLDRIRAELYKQRLYEQRTGPRVPRYWVTTSGELVSIEAVHPSGAVTSASADVPSVAVRYISLQDLLAEAGLEAKLLPTQPTPPAPPSPVEQMAAPESRTLESVVDDIRARLADLDLRTTGLHPDTARDVIRQAVERISDVQISGLSPEDLMVLLGITESREYSDVQELMSLLLFGVDIDAASTISWRELREMPLVHRIALYITSRNPSIQVQQAAEDILGETFVAAAEVLSNPNLGGIPGAPFHGGAVPATLGDYLIHVRERIAAQVAARVRATTIVPSMMEVTGLDESAMEALGGPVEEAKEMLRRHGRRGTVADRLHGMISQLETEGETEQLSTLTGRIRSLLSLLGLVDETGTITIRLSNGRTLTLQVDMENERLILPSGKSVRFTSSTAEIPITQIGRPYPIAVRLRGEERVATSGVGLQHGAAGTVLSIQQGGLPYRLETSPSRIHEALTGDQDVRLLDIETAVAWRSAEATEEQKRALQAISAAGLDPEIFVTDIAVYNRATGQVVYHRMISPEEILAAVREGDATAGLRAMQSQILEALTSSSGAVLGEAVAGYNVEFDIGVLLRLADQLEETNPELASRLRSTIENREVLDILALARAHLPGVPHAALENVARLLGIDVQQAHTAAEDVRYLNDVIDLLISRGAPPEGTGEAMELLLATGGGSVIDEATGMGIYSMRGRVFRPAGQLHQVVMPDGSRQYMLMLQEVVWDGNRWLAGRTVSLSAPSAALLNDMLATMMTGMDARRAAAYSQIAVTDYYQRMIRRVLNPLTEGGELAELGEVLGTTVSAAEGVDLYTVLRYLNRAQMIGQAVENLQPDVPLAEGVRSYLQTQIRMLRNLPEGQLPNLEMLLPSQVAAEVRRMPEHVQRSIVEHLLQSMERYMQQEYLYDPRLIRQYVELYRAMPDLMRVYGEPFNVLFGRMVRGELSPEAAAGVWSTVTGWIRQQLLGIDAIRQEAVVTPGTGYGAERWIRVAFPGAGGAVPIDVPVGSGLTPGQMEAIWRSRLGNVFRRYAGLESPPIDYLLAIGYAHLDPGNVALRRTAIRAMAARQLGVPLTVQQRRVLEQMLQIGEQNRAAFERMMLVHEARRAMDPGLEMDFYTAMVLGSGIPATYAEQLGEGPARQRVARDVLDRISRTAGRLIRARGPEAMPAFATVRKLMDPSIFERTVTEAVDEVQLMRAAGRQEADSILRAATETARSAQVAATPVDAEALARGVRPQAARSKLTDFQYTNLFQLYQQFAQRAEQVTDHDQLLQIYSEVFGGREYIMLGRRLHSTAVRHITAPLRQLERRYRRGALPISQSEWETWYPRIVDALGRAQMADRIRQARALASAMEQMSPTAGPSPQSQARAAAQQSVSEQVSAQLAAGGTVGGEGIPGAAAGRPNVWEGVTEWFRRVNWGRAGRISAGIGAAAAALLAAGAIWAYRPRGLGQERMDEQRVERKPPVVDAETVRLKLLKRVRRIEQRREVMQSVKTAGDTDVEEQDNRRVTMRARERLALDREIAHILEY